MYTDVCFPLTIQTIKIEQNLFSELFLRYEINTKKEKQKPIVERDPMVQKVNVKKTKNQQTWFRLNAHIHMRSNL